MLTAVATSACFAFGTLTLAADSTMPSADASSHFSIESAQIVEVMGAHDGEFKNISYVVLWKGARVSVEDPLSGSSYKVGDTIKVMAHRGHLKDTSVYTLHFTLAEPPAESDNR